MTPVDCESLRRATAAAAQAVLGERAPGGPWVGELSSSALSTATAVTALSLLDRNRHRGLIENGLAWLVHHQNSDGGWGDTVRSRSNLSTTALVWAAFGAATADDRFAECMGRAVGFLTRSAGCRERLVPAIEAVYGADRTFSVPITMMLALSGRLGVDGWEPVRSLPFELAALPRGLFGALRLPVVSYALPALIAIGQVIHHRTRRWNPLRDACRVKTLAVLETLQPEHGGFLEATPLTSFVTMSLAGMGRDDHPVARRGEAFLVNSVRADGSWPIDTNLSTWVTTLAVKALGRVPGALSTIAKAELRDWLLAQQHRKEHPYTGAAPGGWAWTDLPGGVPDADDTAGALLALDVLKESSDFPTAAERAAAEAGVTWLLDLQNADGGLPTFCRGWGTLPFDRSTPELTAHALRAWAAWREAVNPVIRERIERAAQRAGWALKRMQHTDGSWLPLWFGNEAAAGQGNPVYGTAQVLIALGDIRDCGWHLDPECEDRALRWLLSAQAPDGGWGGAPGLPSTIEETSLSLSALSTSSKSEAGAARDRGLQWLLSQLAAANPPPPTPIGLYFAQLWYFERMYPRVFALEALARLARPEESI